MACELNPNPCDECEELYCPDTISDLLFQYSYLQDSIIFHQKKLDESNKELNEFEKEYKNFLELSRLKGDL